MTLSAFKQNQKQIKSLNMSPTLDLKVTSQPFQSSTISGGFYNFVSDDKFHYHYTFSNEVNSANDFAIVNDQF